MGSLLASSGDGRRLQQDIKFWKYIAIAQFCTILWIVFYVKHYEIGSDTLQINSGMHESELSHPTTEHPEKAETRNNRKAKSQFNSAELEMFQSQTKLELVRDLRDNWLKPPSKLPYNITPDIKRHTDLEVKGLHKIVLEQFGGKTNGFFIECGAFDGVWLSNTLHLEQEFNWTGLLVEADPKYYGRLALRQRKAWTINACLSIRPYAEKVQMTRINTEDAISKISELTNQKFRQRPGAEEFQAQCFPLTSILAALGQPLNIDYFSLDVEGAELKILHTIPWDFVYIKVISLEANEERMGPLVDFLASKHYEFITHVKGHFIHDHIFVHKQFKHDRQFGFRS